MQELQNNERIYKILDKLSTIDFSKKNFLIFGKQIKAYHVKQDNEENIYLLDEKDNIQLSRLSKWDLENNFEKEVQYVSSVCNRKQKYVKKYTDCNEVLEQFIILPQLDMESRIYMDTNGTIKKVGYKQYVVYKHKEKTLVVKSLISPKKKRGMIYKDEPYIMDENGKIEKYSEVLKKNNALQKQAVNSYQEAQQELFIENIDNNPKINKLNHNLEKFIRRQKNLIISFYSDEIKENEELIQVLEHGKSIFTHEKSINFEIFLEDDFKGMIPILEKQVNQFVDDYESEKEIEALCNIKLEKLNEKQKQYILRKLEADSSLEDDLK